MILDPIYNSLAASATLRKTLAVRPGTMANTRTALRLYTSFMSRFGIDFNNPTSDELCVYIEYMAQNFSSPHTVTNYFNSVKMALRRMDAEPLSFSSQKVKDLLQAVKLTLRHETVQAPPMILSHLRIILYHVICDYEGPSLCFAYLLMFYTLLRQSNLAPRRASSYDITRHLSRGDITIMGDNMRVKIRAYRISSPFWTESQDPTCVLFVLTDWCYNIVQQ